MTAHMKTRGILAVKANANPIAELDQAFRGFKSSYDARLDELQASVDQANLKAAAYEMGAGSPIARPADPEYTASFSGWIRDGRDEGALKTANREGARAQIQAAMQTGSPSGGGYLAPAEWDRQVIKALEPLSPMRRLATVISTDVVGYSTVWNAGDFESGWVGETAARPDTDTPNLALIEFDHGEIYANPAITQRLLDDSLVNLESWISAELAEEFAEKESAAFVAGDGTNKPKGFLNYVDGGSADGDHPGGNLATFNSEVADGIGDPDSFVDFVYSLAAPYRRNARWLMNSTTAAAVAKLKDGDGNYLWRERYQEGQPSLLLGYPVEISEDMPSIAADAYPIAFGDFARGYVINDRMGVRILRDPYTNKPYVNFYATKRVGGGVKDPEAIIVMRCAVTS